MPNEWDKREHQTESYWNSGSQIGFVIVFIEIDDAF